MRYTALAVVLVLLCSLAPAAKTWRLKDGDKWESANDTPRQQFALKIAELKDLLRTGEADAVEEILAEIKDKFPQYVGPDLDLFVKGELQYWKDKYAKAMKQYEKLLKDYPGSEYAPAVLDREFDMAQAYLDGRKKKVLGFLKISGYAEGIELMERISDRAGLDEPNSVGLKAAVAVAEHYEKREQYIEAYLKWSEVASYWETGPVGKKALLRMAEDNLLAYNHPPARRRALLDSSKLVTAKTYYTKYATLYPNEVRAFKINEKLEQIDELLATKEYTVAQYYRRVGKTEAARMYLERVVKEWPKTEAASLAKEALEETAAEAETRGK